MNLIRVIILMEQPLVPDIIYQLANPRDWVALSHSCALMREHLPRSFYRDVCRNINITREMTCLVARSPANSSEFEAFSSHFPRTRCLYWYSYQTLITRIDPAPHIVGPFWSFDDMTRALANHYAYLKVKFTSIAPRYDYPFERKWISDEMRAHFKAIYRSEDRDMTSPFWKEFNEYLHEHYRIQAEIRAQCTISLTVRASIPSSRIQFVIIQA
jgi:hypothetical protein